MELDEILGLKEPEKVPLPQKTTASIRPAYPWEYKSLRLRLKWHTRPKTIKQWAMAVWNTDMFIGPVPLIKTLAVSHMVIIVLVVKVLL